MTLYKRHGVSNNRFNNLFRLTSNNTSKLRISDLCDVNSSVDSPHKGPVMGKKFHCHDVIMDPEAINSPVENGWMGSSHMILAYIRYIMLPQSNMGMLLCEQLDCLVCTENVIFGIYISYFICLSAVIYCEISLAILNNVVSVKSYSKSLK